MNILLDDARVSAEEAEALARGLLAVARADQHVHPAELALIKSFYADSAGTSPTGVSALESMGDPDPESLAASLSGEALRNVFLKTAFLLAYADGACTAHERAVIERYATGFGVDPASLASHEQSVKEHMVAQLSRLANVEAVAAVARKLGV